MHVCYGFFFFYSLFREVTIVFISSSATTGCLPSFVLWFSWLLVDLFAFSLSQIDNVCTCQLRILFNSFWGKALALLWCKRTGGCHHSIESRTQIHSTQTDCMGTQLFRDTFSMSGLFPLHTLVSGFYIIHAPIASELPGRKTAEVWLPLCYYWKVSTESQLPAKSSERASGGPAGNALLCSLSLEHSRSGQSLCSSLSWAGRVSDVETVLATCSPTHCSFWLRSGGLKAPLPLGSTHR